MKFMLFALASASLFASAYAHLDEQKTKISQNVDKRIESLNKMKSCVQGAADQAAIKVCREAHRKEMNAVADMMIDEKINKLQEKKAKRAQKAE